MCTGPTVIVMDAWVQRDLYAMAPITFNSKNLLVIR